MAGPRKRPPAALPHQVRIIGGRWKRTPLAVVDAEGLRPTPDRVRETVFNWLNHLLGGRWDGIACLDLFAGSGALGFEAASRGAARALLVESSPAALKQLEAAKVKLQASQVELVRGDALALLRSLAERPDRPRFDLVFLDPPYRHALLPELLPRCAAIMAGRGLVYAESETPLGGENAPGWLADWEVIRADRAGMVYFHLLQRKIPPDFEA
jgi:16S rRNA (guanine966-N2)-methyltransferase